MKYCQNPSCYLYSSQDRLRTVNGEKDYTNRKRTNLGYSDNFCTLQCQSDWFREYGDRCIEYIGRITVSQTRPKESAGYWEVRMEHAKQVRNELGENYGGAYSTEWYKEYNTRINARVKEHFNNQQQGDNNGEN